MKRSATFELRKPLTINREKGRGGLIERGGYGRGVAKFNRQREREGRTEDTLSKEEQNPSF